MARKKEDKREEMSFLDHLEELRWHIVRSAMGAFVFMIVAFVNRNFIFNEVILKPHKFAPLTQAQAEAKAKALAQAKSAAQPKTVIDEADL